MNNRPKQIGGDLTWSKMGWNHRKTSQAGWFGPVDNHWRLLDTGLVEYEVYSDPANPPSSGENLGLGAHAFWHTTQICFGIFGGGCKFMANKVKTFF